MNKNLQLTFKTIFTIIILWFIGYFVFGENISLEFADYNFAQLFPKILTFAAGASIYFLFLLNIKKEDGWGIPNILKGIAGVIFGFVPFILFKYYSSVGNCQNWEVFKQEKNVLFESVSSQSETIKTIQIYCPEMNQTTEKTYRVMAITPIFNTISEVDTVKIKRNHWKKIK